MDYFIRCPHCAVRLEVGSDETARQMSCPECGHSFVVPVTGVTAGVTTDGFWVKRRVSGGSVSEIFEVQQIATGEKLLLKVLSPLVAQDLDAGQPYADYLHRVQVIDHPHVVRLREVGVFMGHAYLAYPPIEGTCLDAYLDLNGAMPDKEAIKTGIKVARVLKEIWDTHQLLHLGLKPANLLLRPDGEISLLDFGHNRLLLPTDEHLQRLVGSPPYYFSPEQILGQEELDYRSDMYALGATLYHLATGQAPYHGGDVAEVFGQHLEAPLQRPSRIHDGISTEFDKLIQTMMAKDREDRFLTWDDALNAMKLALKGGGRRQTTKTKLNLIAPKSTTMTSSGGKTLLASELAAPVSSKGRTLIIAIVVVAILGFLAIFISLAMKDQGSGASKAANATKVIETDRKLEAFEQRFQEGRRYMVDHPEDFDGAIERFTKLRTDAVDTEYQQKAHQEILNLRKAKKAAKPGGG